ncbi:hypothetical protein G3A49_00340 [Haloferax volcanii]|uniref:VIT family protein n=3 Tax=Haloferax volcanii TaxID=2246 RepID=A0A6C0UMH4_HALVO|nr:MULTISPECIES: hypothetical protein [Haloferax]ELK55274.1 integral membrane protein [Haloferax sp. BAB-2207]ELZ70345.1 integral membrane protein [Haloferax lucentense DSM 14919]ELZ90157.1 integral membrane protein [Haloferax alexandrinus JCM 10717]NLV01034.1 hypothetical protein [Haloferax alexandrinus]QIB76672.1 hypothetical protein G3A49_00340 [Haloferax alexandrinus]
MLETLLGDDVESSGRYLPELIYGANDGIVTTFAVGASRCLVTNRSWLANGVEMFVVGMAAATVAYAVGNLLAGVA